MMKLLGRIVFALGLLSVTMQNVSADSGDTLRWAGGDISLLPLCEEAGAIYKDHNGMPIAEILPWVRQQGMNAMRVRLFVNPGKYKERYENASAETRYDPNACQDLEYIMPLCKRIVENGFELLLDFHYSDTWADPAKQWTPIEWEMLNDTQLADTLYSYTRYVLQALKDNDIVPKFIQPGNEISYGFLWGQVGTSSPKTVFMGSDANWERFGMLLKRAVAACREVCPDASIVLHTERVAQPDVLVNFYDKMQSMGVEYDIIGLSYYPYYHGDISVLNTALSILSSRYEKHIMLVETGYSYKWAVPGTTFDFSAKWPYSDAGQALYAKQLVELLKCFSKVDGLFWWWMEYNAYNTSLSGWYNAPLFDSTTGCVTTALQEIASFASGNNSVGIVSDDNISDVWYDLNGRRLYSVPSLPGIYINGSKKVIVR